MTYRVRALRAADRDVDAVVDWMIEERGSDSGAEAWLSAYRDATHRLANNAAGCSLAPESDWLDMDVRETFFHTRKGRNYRILFTIEKQEVLILRVRGPGQDWLQPGDV